MNHWNSAHYVLMHVLAIIVLVACLFLKSCSIEPGKLIEGSDTSARSITEKVLSYGITFSRLFRKDPRMDV